MSLKVLKMALQILESSLKRNFISCELHPEYYEMIQERLANNGKISNEHRLEFIQEKNKEDYLPNFLQLELL